MFLQRFAAVIMRIREPKTTALIFASGKMVSLAKVSGTFIYSSGCSFYIPLKCHRGLL
jgi:TATA-box binding protein (TBP) (component of TFIID and TFIIIB)